jgi:hypothetical protein
VKLEVYGQNEPEPGKVILKLEEEDVYDDYVWIKVVDHLGKTILYSYFVTFYNGKLSINRSVNDTLGFQLISGSVLLED